jgi:hypothetical protein
MAQVGTKLYLGDKLIEQSFLGNFQTLINPIPSNPYMFRTDPYSGSLVLAMPYTQFSQLGMSNFYSDVSADIRGTGTNYVLVPTGSGTFQTATTTPVSSGSYAFATNDGYSAALDIAGLKNAGTITTTAANFGSNNFVVECWFNLKGTFTNPPFNMLIFGEVSGDFLLLDYSNALAAFRYYTNASNSWTTNPAWTKNSNVWYHLAFVRSGTNKYVYLNGNRIGVGTYSGAITNPGDGYWRILGNAASTNDGVEKWVQDFRLYIGTDKGYTGATITVPPSIVTLVN